MTNPFMIWQLLSRCAKIFLNCWGGEMGNLQLSLALLMLVSRGDRSWVMLPVFMTRNFFHTGILVRKDAGIEQPKDLRGKRVAVHEYVQTAGMWARGVLSDEFGVRP